MKLILLLLVAIAASATFAQTRSAAILITKNDDSAISNRFAYEIKEQLAKSSTVKSVPERDAAIVARMVLLDVKPGGKPDVLVAYSLVLTTRIKLYDHYLTSSIMTCGLSVLESCARDVIASISETQIWEPVEYTFDPKKRKP